MNLYGRDDLAIKSYDDNSLIQLDKKFTDFIYSDVIAAIEYCSKHLKLEQHPKGRVLYMTELATAYMLQGTSYDSTVHYILSTYHWADSLNMDYFLARAKTQASIYNVQANLYPEAKQRLKAADSLAYQINDQDLIHFCLILKGEFSFYDGNDQLSIKQLNEALAHFESEKRLAEAAITLNVLGYVLFKKEELAASIRCIKQAIKYINEKGYQSLKNMVYSNLGFIYVRLDDYDNAYKTLKECIELSDEKGDLNYKGLAANTLAEYFQNKAIQDSAYHYASMGFDIGETIHCRNTMAKSSLMLSTILLNKDKHSEAKKNVGHHFQKMQPI